VSTASGHCTFSSMRPRDPQLDFKKHHTMPSAVVGDAVKDVVLQPANGDIPDVDEALDIDDVPLSQLKEQHCINGDIPDVDQDNDIHALDIDDVPLSQLKEHHCSRTKSSYYKGATDLAWDHLATFCHRDPQSDESDVDYGPPTLVGELRAGDVVAFFYYRKIFGDVEGLIWERIPSIVTGGSFIR
jgi:hypothetical protein